MGLLMVPIMVPNRRPTTLTPGCMSTQDEDISVHYRPYASTHGGRAFYASSKGSGSASGDDSTHHLRKRSLKKSGSAVMLSEMELEGSYHG